MGPNEKPSVPKSLEGLRGCFFCDLYQLFSSFLRGASRPKSPRDAAITADSFMLDIEVLVKSKVSPSFFINNSLLTFCVQLLGAKRFQWNPAGWPVNVEAHHIARETPAQSRCYTLGRWTGPR